MMRNILKPAALSLCFGMLAACSQSNSNKNSKETASDASPKYKIAMSSDTAGINDQSFNQSAWEGLQALHKENSNVSVKYLESHQNSDFITNLEKLVDENQDLIFAIGFAQESAAQEAAEKNPDKSIVLVDSKFSQSTPSNAASIDFKSQEPSFLAGFAAAMTTKTNHIGFIGGMQGEIIGRFEYGFRAGALFAANKSGKSIDVAVQYAGSFNEPAKGKAIASKMIDQGCDIIFHACADTGVGMIEEVKERGKLAIGVDRDQSSLAPDNILTSVLKNTGAAIKSMAEKFIKEGKQSIQGKTLEYGLKDGALGLPKDNKNMSSEVYKSTMEIQEKIIKGEIVVPNDEASFNEFSQKLKK
jgi:basic membrane protein A